MVEPVAVVIVGCIFHRKQDPNSYSVSLDIGLPEKTNSDQEALWSSFPQNTPLFRVRAQVLHRRGSVSVWNMCVCVPCSPHVHTAWKAECVPVYQGI